MNRQQRRAAEKRQKKALRKGAPAANDSAGQAAYVQAILADALRQHKAGNLVSAEAAYQEVISHRPDIAAAHNALGAVYNSQGRHEDALKCFNAALDVEPGLKDAEKNKRNTLGLLGRDTIKKALSEDKLEQADELFTEATRLQAKGELESALNTYQDVIKLNPGHARAYANMGTIMHDLDNFEMSEVLIQSAIAFEPDNAGSYNSLGLTYLTQGKITEAIEALSSSVELNSSNISALTNMGNAFKEAGKAHDALSFYRKALAVAPKAEAHGNILFTMNYMPEFDQKAILKEHRLWNREYAAPLAPVNKSFKNTADPKKRIRIGLISGSFRRHPVGFLTVSALEAVSKDRFELFFYTNSTTTDYLTERYQAIADNWQSIIGVSNEDLAAQIEDDEIDILLDLAGHSDGTRLLALAQRPAPVQVKWVGGQFNTTGMDTIDYFISDKVETPDSVDDSYTEEIVRLPDGYVCYDPPAYIADVGPLPAKQNGYVTFGSFNNTTKVTPETIELWANILNKVPNSRIVLKSRPLNDNGVKDYYMEQFVRCGVDAGRVELRGSSPHEELLRQYNDIDIALDPFPYSGGLTTVEALYMGVPVITNPGETFAARHAASHISNAGLQNWVCDSYEDYADKAVTWANDLDGLAELRQGLRDKVQTSPLCNADRFAKNLEAALRDMWVKWCDQQT